MIKILYAGGGTIGPVSPLIAVHEEMKRMKLETESLWIGTKNGPEHELLKKYGISTKIITSAKLRRYFSLKNFLIPFYVFIGIIQSFFILRKFKPSVIVSAGGFVSVPLIWAGKFLGVKSIIHQQDIRSGLANKLCSSPATFVTVTFKKSMKDFPQHKVVHIGNPVRTELLNTSKKEGVVFFHFQSKIPIILILGGGTGSSALNKLVLNGLNDLVKFCQVIHITGHNRSKDKASHVRYVDFEFLTEGMKYAYAASDLVVCRAGLSTLTELAALRKPAVVIPIPNSHQMDNAIYFSKNNAIKKLDQKNLKPPDFATAIKKTLEDKAGMQNLQRNIGKLMMEDATLRMIEIILQVIKKK